MSTKTQHLPTNHHQIHHQIPHTSKNLRHSSTVRCNVAHFVRAAFACPTATDKSRCICRAALTGILTKHPKIHPPVLVDTQQAWGTEPPPPPPPHNTQHLPRRRRRRRCSSLTGTAAFAPTTTPGFPTTRPSATTACFAGLVGFLTFATTID